MEIIKNGFTNERLGVSLDVYLINGKEWFKAQELSSFLGGYKDTNDMTKYIGNKDKNTFPISNRTAQGNEYTAILIDELALYEIILKIRNTQNNPERYIKAREFQDWVFGEVLPSIRKNNYYVDDTNISTTQISNLTKHVNKLILEKNILHEILYDITESTTMSFTEASLGIFGKDAKYLSKMLIEHGFLDSNKNILKQESEFITPKGEKELIRIFTKTDVQRAKKDKDIRYAKITNFGYMYLKKYFIGKGLSKFCFTREELKIKEL